MPGRALSRCTNGTLTLHGRPIPEQFGNAGIVIKSHAVWECSVTARCISGKAKYSDETDSAQVVRTKDDKHSVKRVKQRLKQQRGKVSTLTHDPELAHGLATAWNVSAFSVPARLVITLPARGALEDLGS